MTPQQSTLDASEQYSGNGHVIVGNGKSLSISHISTHNLSRNVKLLDVLVVP